MTFLKFPRFSRKSAPVVAINMSLNSWCYQSRTQSNRFVQKVEMCTAVCMVNTPHGKNHHHTILRVFLVPVRTGRGVSVDTLLIERVLSTGGACHSVTPIGEMFPISGTSSHPDVHDRVCIVSNVPSTTLAHHLVVERTLTFSDRASEPHLTLSQFAQILAFVSRSTKLICDVGDCRFQSRSLAFTCLVALAPSLPPRKSGERVDTRIKCGTEMVDDSMFELSAEAFLGQVPWLVRDPASIQALKLIWALKDEPRERAKARLYH